MAGRVQFDAAAASPSKVEEDDIEAKFQEYLAKKKAGKKANPMYSTSNSVIGHFPSGASMPEPSKYGKSCKFSDLYVGARSKSEGLITGMDKSRVHKAFDQGF